MILKKITTLTLLIFLTFSLTLAQEQESSLSREQIMKMSVEELSDLPLEELMGVMDVMGVSNMDELYNLIMNKGVKSASKKVENAFDAPISSTVLTREEIDSYGATTFEEALRLVPGVIVREKTNGYYDVHLRGLDNLPPKNMLIFSQNNKTLLMVDGRPVFNYINGGTLWEALPIGIEDLERIEVVRGPASALYGPNAVNGVINLITKDMSSQPNLVKGSVKGGTMSTYIGEIAVHNGWENGFSAGITSNFQHRDRETEKIYFFPSANRVIRYPNNSILDVSQGGFYSIKDYELMKERIGENVFLPVLDPRDDINELFEDPGLSRENMGVNGYLQYDPKGKMQFKLSGGYQSSHLNASTLGDSPTSFWGRKAKSAYANLTGNVGHLFFQTNYMSGNRNFHVGNPGFHLDVGQFNASAEYDLQLKSLNLRPGISYQSVYYDDSPYLDGEDFQNGYLNGKKELNTASISLRADYMAFGKLRLVAAFRADKYTNPDPWYASWQFATTYALAKNRTLRAVYSRANNSSLILNTHSDYRWDRSDLGLPPDELHFSGTPDINLMTVDMVEIGYRSRLWRSVLIDAEIFASESRDYINLVADHSSVDLATGKSYVQITYKDSPLNARQIGGTINLDWIITEKLIAKAHATMQETTLQDYFDYAKNEVIAMQLGRLQQGQGEVIDGKLVSDYSPTDLKDDVEHKATPGLYGMIGMIYRPTEKFEISANGYYTGEQTFINQNTTVIIDAKTVFSGQISYRPIENIEVFVHGHNLFNNTSTEFAFMDPVGALYLGGLRFNF
jgi:iron complex outermembrane receptor protein